METNKKNILFITGRPRSGKSTLVQEIIKKLAKKKISGLITPELRNKKGERRGFLLRDLKSGKEEILASVKIKSKYRVGKYKVNVPGIDKMVKVFLESFEEAELIIIDELGVMELKSRKFREVMEEILESNKPCLITLHRNLVGKYKSKGKVFWLERENFEEVEKEVKKRLLEV